MKIKFNKITFEVQTKIKVEKFSKSNEKVNGEIHQCMNLLQIHQ